MNPMRHQRIKAAFQAALAAEPAELDRVLHQACLGDAVLLAEVRELLQHHADAGDFMTKPAFGQDFHVARALADLADFCAGPYRAIAVIGTGTHGIVYRAQHMATGEMVALKVLRPSAIGSHQPGALKAEAAALARLAHRNIAGLRDSGTVIQAGAAVSYVAQELVDGQPLVDHLRHSGLSLAALLEVLATAADAVQFAHDRGIAHNDLKPDHVMIAADGTVKIIDFGLAHWLEGTAAPLAGGGTLAYCEPERWSGRSNAVGNDIYSLGAIAYEALAGRPPLCFEHGMPSGVDAMARREAWPLRALKPELPADLETVVHHALHPAQLHRYRRAGDFAADLRCCIQGQPIAAPRPSLLRRWRRLAGPHRAATAALVVAGICLLTGMLGISLALAEARRSQTFAEQQHQLAEQRRSLAQASQARSERATEMLISILRSATAHTNGSPPSLELAFTRAAERLRASVDRDLQAARAHQALGLSLHALGRYELAADELEQALRLTEPGDDASHADLVIDLGIAMLASGRLAEALTQLQRAEALLVGSNNAASTQRCKYNLALAAYRAGDQKAAAAHLMQLPREVTDPSTISIVVGGQLLAATMAGDRGDHAEAARILQACLAGPASSLPAEDSQRLAIHNNLGLAYLQLEQIEQCELAMMTALAGRRAAFGPAHPETLQSLHNLATLRTHQGRFEEAENLHREVVAARTLSLGKEHPQTLVSTNNLARMLERVGNPEEAEQLLLAVVEAAERCLPPGHHQTTVHRRNLAMLWLRTGRRAAAKPLLERCLQDAETHLGPEHSFTRELRSLVGSTGG